MLSRKIVVMTLSPVVPVLQALANAACQQSFSPLEIQYQTQCLLPIGIPFN